MATYTGTPRTWTAGETVTAALMNSDVRDPLAALSGAWSPYTPTLGGFTAGNGVLAGKYLQVGKLVIFRASFTFGSTSAAASAVPTLSLPVTAATATFASGYALFADAGTSLYAAVAALISTTAAGAYSFGSNGIFVIPTTTAPFTWTTGDSVTIGGIYEAA